MTDTILTSEQFVKSFTNISDNLENKYLRPAIVEAQEFQLQKIVGSALYRKLLDYVNRTSGLVVKPNPADARFVRLLNVAQYLIAYQAVADVLPRISVKVANMGAIMTGGEHIQQLSMNDVFRMAQEYRNKAAAYTDTLQRFLRENRADYPELDECGCGDVPANLSTSFDCGIVLGGVRGRGRRL